MNLCLMFESAAGLGSGANYLVMFGALPCNTPQQIIKLAQITEKVKLNGIHDFVTSNFSIQTYF